MFENMFEKITRLVHTQHFPQNGHFLLPDTHTYVRVRVRITG